MKIGKKKAIIAFALVLVLLSVALSGFRALEREIYQGHELLDDLHKTTFFIRGELGISSWDTEAKWYEGTDTLARMCGIQNKHGGSQRMVNYDKVYFLDGQSYEFWEIMVRLANVKWEDPRREEIVKIVQSLNYYYSMGGRFHDILFVDKGIYIHEGDYEKVLELLREDEEDWVFDRGQYYMRKDG
ncbi:MAG: hypothetical protein IJ486_02575 [Firmicutes bacterium]|nr:hypothetical protein [Bacillota bacterium]